MNKDKLNVIFVSVDDIHPNCTVNNIVKPGNCTFGVCFHADQINEDAIEKCTDPGTYDYFSDSSVSYIFTFLGVGTFFCGKL